MRKCTTEACQLSTPRSLSRAHLARKIEHAVAACSAVLARPCPAMQHAEVVIDASLKKHTRHQQRSLNSRVQQISNLSVPLGTYLRPAHLDVELQDVACQLRSLLCQSFRLQTA